MSDRYKLILNLRQCACRRAHLAGARAAENERKAHEFYAEAERPSVMGFKLYCVAAEIARELAAADRRLYWRELATADRLGGHPTPFDALG